MMHEGLDVKLDRQKRDELLIRLDERTENTLSLVREQKDDFNEKIGKVEAHLAILNGSVATVQIRSAVNKRWLIVLTSVVLPVCIGIFFGALPV